MSKSRNIALMICLFVHGQGKFKINYIIIAAVKSKYTKPLIKIDLCF